MNREVFPKKKHKKGEKAKNVPAQNNCPHSYGNKELDNFG